MNKVIYTQSPEGVHFEVKCETTDLIERLVQHLSPYNHSSIETELASYLHQPEVQTRKGDYKLVYLDKCDVSFLWPKWLKAPYISMYPSGHLWVCWSSEPSNDDHGWYGKGTTREYQLQSEVFDIQLPRINASLWKETLTKNPWNGQEESST